MLTKPNPRRKACVSDARKCGHIMQIVITTEELTLCGDRARRVFQREAKCKSCLSAVNPSPEIVRVKCATVS